MSYYVVAVMIATMVAKVIGFARELLLSYFFGAGPVSDSYLISLTIPGTIFQFVGTGLLTSFIPIYLKMNKRSEKEARTNFVNTVITCILVFSMVVCVLVWMFTKEFIFLFASGFEGETLELAIVFTRINVLSLFAATFVYAYISHLQANEKILETQLSVIPYGVILLLSIVLGAKIDLMLLPIGSVVASIVQSLILLFCVLKSGYKYRPKLDVHADPFKKFIRVLGPVILGVSINDINILVDKTMASNIAVGAISSLSYSYSLTMFIQGVFVQSITSIYYPKITKSITNGNKNELSKNIGDSLSIMMYFLIPITVYCLISSNGIIDILYGRGAFDSAAVSLTSGAFWGYSCCFVWVALRELFSRVFYANKNTKTPTLNAFIGGILNIILNILLSKWFGVLGLALATSISAFITSILLYISLREKGIYRINKSDIVELIKMIICSVVLTVILLLIRAIVHVDSVVLTFVIELLVGSVVYLISTHLLKIKTISSFFKIAKAKIRCFVKWSAK